MKQLPKETITSPVAVPGCAAVLLATVPPIMNCIRTEMRRHRPAGLSVPQLRALVFLYRHPEASLSQVADHLGFKLPTTSKIINAMVRRRLIVRRPSPKDRRCLRLRLSVRGGAELRRAQSATEMRLAEILAGLTPAQQSEVTAVLNLLRPLFQAVTLEAAPGAGAQQAAHE